MAAILDVYETLEKHFGFRAFLEGQEKVVEAVLEGSDTLVVMPTGGGKSLCYQLPALVKEGLCLVISPLIALMKDQVDALEQRGIAATLINSTLSPGEQWERIRRMADGGYKLVYIAPERFRHKAFLQALEKVGVSFVAVDEAHCVSQWGHDFRPDYLSIARALKKCGEPQVVALTATATPEVQADIVEQLKLRAPKCFVSGFERPNLSLQVKHVEGAWEKMREVERFCRELKTGIVYAATRKNVEKISEELETVGVAHAAYHAGMDEKQRHQAQDLFISRKVSIAVATNAFGMGIDRPDVRFVVHYDIPGSVEAYYQEVGRAGRDGEPSACRLLFNYVDTRVQEFFIEGSNPSKEEIMAVYEWLQGQENFDVVAPLRVMAEQVPGLGNDMALGTCLHLLERAGYVERYDIPGKRVRGTKLLRPEVLSSQLDLDYERLEQKADRDRAKLRKMVDLAYYNGCRQHFILEYFGEKEPTDCGQCDNCLDHEHGEIREATEAENEMVRKALSGVARMSHGGRGQWTGRFGIGRVLQTLQASRSQEIIQAKLDLLSTYGLLSEVPGGYLRQLFDELKKMGYIEVSEGEYPLVTLTKRGDEVMFDGALTRLHWPEMKQRRKSGKAQKERAIGTMGAGKKKSGIETALATLEYLVLGKSEEEVAQERGLSLRTVEGHVSCLFSRGEKRIHVDDFVARERQGIILSRAPAKVERIREVKDALPAHYSYREICYTLAAHGRWKP